MIVTTKKLTDAKTRRLQSTLTRVTLYKRIDKKNRPEVEEGVVDRV